MAGYRFRMQVKSTLNAGGWGLPQGDPASMIRVQFERLARLVAAERRAGERPH